MQAEKKILNWTLKFCYIMGWNIPIARIKISRMPRYRGLCINCDEENYIVISEIANRDNKEFFYTLIHELIHAKLYGTKHHSKAHKHGKAFKKLARKVEKETNGFYTVKGILK